MTTTEIIHYIEQVKKEKGVFPTYALKRQILRVMQQNLDKDLQRLLADGVIKETLTFNDVAFELINK